jgi:hypothetical protein
VRAADPGYPIFAVSAACLALLRWGLARKAQVLSILQESFSPPSNALFGGLREVQSNKKRENCSNVEV